MLDTDDEVRDRATYYKNILKYNIRLDFFIINNDFDTSLPCLEQCLVDYISNSVTASDDCFLKFNLDSVQKQPSRLTGPLHSNNYFIEL